jgi:acetyl-CoA carboxylase biotin carboxyl carrier protein
LDVEKLKAILAALEGTDVTRLTWTTGEESIDLRLGHPPPPTTSVHAVPVAAAGVPVSFPTPPSVEPVAAQPAPLSTSAQPADDKKTFTVNSPFVGTFYRSASPESAVFADVGAVVRKGQVLCIVEAMKLMNEIEAEQPGRLVEVLVQNGSPVEYGEALFRFEPV